MPVRKRAISPRMRIRIVKAPKGFRVSSVTKLARPRGAQIVFIKPKTRSKKQVDLDAMRQKATNEKDKEQKKQAKEKKE